MSFGELDSVAPMKIKSEAATRTWSEQTQPRRSPRQEFGFGFC